MWSASFGEVIIGHSGCFLPTLLLFRMFLSCWVASPVSSWCDSFPWLASALTCWPPKLACLCIAPHSARHREDMMKACILKQSIGVRVLGCRMKRNFRRTLVLGIKTWIGFKRLLALYYLLPFSVEKLFSAQYNYGESKIFDSCFMTTHLVLDGL